MSVPVLGESPSGGSRVTPGALVVSFGLTSGTLRMSVGTSAGDDDVHVEEITLPDTIAFTVPATGPLFASVWHEDGESSTYTWAWGVGTGTRAPGQVKHEAEVGHLVSSWKRSELVAYEQGLEVPDPGHGLDAISPITFLGHPFNTEDVVHVAPFTVDEVANKDTGTGYLRCLVRPLGVRQTIPGCPPTEHVVNLLEVTIITPSNRGPELAYLYAGVLKMLYTNVHLTPAEAGIVDIYDTETPIQEIPVYRGDDGTWSHHRLDIELEQRRQVPSAGAR